MDKTEKLKLPLVTENDLIDETLLAIAGSDENSAMNIIEKKFNEIDKVIGNASTLVQKIIDEVK